MSPFRRRHTRYRKSKMPLMWFAIILLVAVLLAAVLGLGGGLLNFIDKNANVLDSQYIQSIPNIPKDIDRDTLEELKKKWNQKQSNP